MSNQTLSKQPNQAIEPIGKKSIEPSSKKSIEPTGKNSIEATSKKSIMPLTTDKKDIEVTMINLKLSREEYNRLTSQIQPPQPSTTINVQINNNIQNNYYNGPPPEAQNQGHQGGSQDRPSQGQGLQTTAPANRAIENKPGAVKNGPSTSNPTHTTQQKSQNGSGDTANSSRPAKVQTHPTQDRPRVETTSVPPTRPATGQVPPRPTHDGIRKPASTNVAAGHVPGQVRREGSQPKDKKHSGLIDKLLHPNSNGASSSPKRANTPTSAAIPTPRGSNSSHSNESRNFSTVQTPQKQVNSQAARGQNHARGEPTRHPASERPVARPHGEPQPRRQDGSSGVPHGQSAVNQRTEAAPAVAKELKEEGIWKGLEDLNARLGNYKTKTRGGPARLIMIGKAFAEMKKLDQRDETYHIDVILDLDAADERRSCMRQKEIFKVFREFDEPQKPHGKETWESFFGPNRAKVLRDVAQTGECIFKKAHLQVYLMDKTRALHFELTRIADPDMEDNVRRASESIVVGLLWSLCEYGAGTYRSWRYIRSEDGSRIPEASIKRVEELFEKRYPRKNSI